jgi:hypothetical protein
MIETFWIVTLILQILNQQELKCLVLLSYLPRRLDRLKNHDMSLRKLYQKDLKENIANLNLKLHSKKSKFSLQTLIHYFPRHLKFLVIKRVKISFIPK